MTAGKAKELLRQLVKTYFDQATVIFSRQSRVAKPEHPLVTLTPGDVRRTMHPAISTVDGMAVRFFPSRIAVTIDLFTNGKPLEVDGKTVAYIDSAMDDLQAFSNFLDSEYALNWCFEKDIAIQIDGEARDMTGLINDTNYEYRSQLQVGVYFTQMSTGRAGVLDEESLHGADQFPSESVTGEQSGKWKDTTDGSITIDPESHENSSGGGGESNGLPGMETGYFTSAEVKEGKEEEANEQKL